MLPVDPTADISRRAWIDCPSCADHQGCPACGAGRNCPDHWRYVLAWEGRSVHVQCRTCTHLWVHDTRFGAPRA
ncbi:hypothetical protein ACFV3R_18615 [Streptomyces sp. NPDC059740]|uniref:hypothetical protein n=1 Tax=Streptomyces sp. NPDC059740 TaxID=3346926 RepID=UPI003665BF76